MALAPMHRLLVASVERRRRHRRRRLPTFARVYLYGCDDDEANNVFRHGNEGRRVQNAYLNSIDSAVLWIPF